MGFIRQGKHVKGAEMKRLRKILKPSLRQRFRVWWQGEKAPAEDRAQVDAYKSYRTGLTLKGRPVLAARNKRALEFFGSELVSNEHRKALVKNMLKGTAHEKFTGSILSHLDKLDSERNIEGLSATFSNAIFHRAIKTANEKSLLPARLLNLLATRNKVKKEILAAGFVKGLESSGFSLPLHAPEGTERPRGNQRTHDEESGAEGGHEQEINEGEHSGLTESQLHQLIEQGHEFSTRHGLNLVTDVLPKLAGAIKLRQPVSLGETADQELSNSPENVRLLSILASHYGNLGKQEKIDFRKFANQKIRLLQESA